jgi:hypothetical protein
MSTLYDHASLVGATPPAVELTAKTPLGSRVYADVGRGPEEVQLMANGILNGHRGIITTDGLQYELHATTGRVVSTPEQLKDRSEFIQDAISIGRPERVHVLAEEHFRNRDYT